VSSSQKQPMALARWWIRLHSKNELAKNEAGCFGCDRSGSGGHRTLVLEERPKETTDTFAKFP